VLSSIDNQFEPSANVSAISLHLHSNVMQTDHFSSPNSRLWVSSYSVSDGLFVQGIKFNFLYFSLEISGNVGEADGNVRTVAPSSKQSVCKFYDNSRAI
jgi:hypothetical protein